MERERGPFGDMGLVGAAKGGPKERLNITENPHPTQKEWGHREADTSVHGAMLWGGKSRG